MNHYTLKAPLLSLPTIERILKLIPEAHYDDLTDPDRFTLREALAHLADWEQIFFERIQGAIREDHYVVVPLDENVRSVTEKYAEQPVGISMALFRARREATMAYVRGLTPEQSEKPLTHPELGPMRVSDLVDLLALHDLYHIEHLTQYLESKTAGTW